MKKNIWSFVVAGVLFAYFLPSYVKMQDLKAKNNEYAKAIESLKRRNAQLEQERYLLESDPVYLEKVARARMGLIRDGEKVYRMVPAAK